MIQLYDSRSGTWDGTLFKRFKDIIPILEKNGKYKIIGLKVTYKGGHFLPKEEHTLIYRIKNQKIKK